MSKKKLIAIFFIVLFLTPVLISHAQESSVRPVKPIQSVGQSAVVSAQDAAGTDQVITDRIIQKRLDAVERVKDKRESFREKLATIKDERKRAIVERIDNRISTINENRTNRFAEALEKLNLILDRIINKTNSLESEGVDVTELNNSIVIAQSALNNAEDAVEGQAGKEYVIEIDTESTLGSVVSSTVRDIKNDLRIVHQAVVDARTSIRKTVGQLRATMKSGNADNNPANVQSVE